MGHVSQIPNPGDFITHDLTGSPLLIVRQDDGSVAARLNVCRHRGTRLENAPCGSKRAFVCPYHGWSYGRDGAQLGMPHGKGFEGVPARNLAPVSCGVAAGLIFVSRASAMDLDAWLGPIKGELEGFGLGETHFINPRLTHEPISWMLGIDLFLEAYHLKPTHKNSIYPMFFDNLGVVDPIGPHLRNLFPKRSIDELRTTDPETWELREHSNVLYHLFPCTLVLVMGDHTSVVTLLPDTNESMHVSVFTLVENAPETDKARAYWAANNKILYDATDEDFAMGASIQKGLASGANRDFVFAAYEHALTHFHAEISRRAR